METKRGTVRALRQIENSICVTLTTIIFTIVLSNVVHIGICVYINIIPKMKFYTICET